MLTDYLQLVAEWDYTRNTLDVNKVTAGSAKKAWWNCSKQACHYWQTTINSRTTKKSGCPICRGLKICPADKCNSLAVVHAELVENEWDYTRNTLKPDEITPGCKKKAWWKCTGGHHVYESTILNKTSKDYNCAVCSNRQICPIDACNSLGKLYPVLCRDWHPTMNKKSPLEYTSGSCQKVWWKCRKCAYEWEFYIDSRTRLKRGCPRCADQN